MFDYVAEERDDEPAGGSHMEGYPVWVRPLCEIPRRSRLHGELSPRALVEQAAPDLGDAQFDEVLTSYLVEHPRLIEDWYDYAGDKRVVEGPYWDNLEVGYMVGAARRDALVHHRWAAAATDYIRWHVEWILSDRRTR